MVFQFCLSSNLRLNFKQLPPMLRNKSHTTTINCSKVPRGLCFPLEVSGLCTRIVCSGDLNLGQWQPRYAIHAGRHSNDKAFRYLKRIIVIPAVYLLLAPLNWNLKYKHWADVTNYTHLCRLCSWLSFC